MAKRKQPFNPFYAALLIIGVAFTITACAYALMMLRATRPVRSSSAELASLVDGEPGLMKLLDERGMEILGIEVLLLALATVGAIALDQYRSGNDRISSGAETDRGLECSPRRGQTLVAGSEAPDLIRRHTADPEGVEPGSGSTPSRSM